MPEFWKLRTILPPPVCSLKKEVIGINFDTLTEACKTLHQCGSILSDRSLASELCLLTKLIYKMTGQFRSNRIMRGLKRVESCLKRYMEMNLFSVLNKYTGCMMESYLLECTEHYLPSRQMLEYLLIQWMRADVLLVQTANYCSYTFFIIQKSLHCKGDMIPQNTLFLAIVSRVWVFCKSLCIYLEQWYSKLLPCLALVDSTQVAWLPENHIMPEKMSGFVQRHVTLDTWTSGETQLESSIEEGTGDELADNEDTASNSCVSVMESISNVREEDIGAAVSRQAHEQSSLDTSSVQTNGKDYASISPSSITNFTKKIKASQSIIELLCHLEKLKPMEGLNTVDISKVKKKLLSWNKRFGGIEGKEMKTLKKGCVLVQKLLTGVDAPVQNSVSTAVPEISSKKSKILRKSRTSGDTVKSLDDSSELVEQSKNILAVNKRRGSTKRSRNTQKSRLGTKTIDDPVVSNIVDGLKKEISRQLEVPVVHQSNDGMEENGRNQSLDSAQSSRTRKKLRRMALRSTDMASVSVFSHPNISTKGKATLLTKSIANTNAPHGHVALSKPLGKSNDAVMKKEVSRTKRKKLNKVEKDRRIKLAKKKLRKKKQIIDIHSVEAMKKKRKRKKLKRK